METKNTLGEIVEKMHQTQKVNFIITTHDTMKIKSLGTVDFEDIIFKKTS